MISSLGKGVFAAAAAAATFLLSSPAVARPMSVRGLAAQEVQLATIAYRIGAASAATCANREMMTGMVVHDLTRYDASVRPAISRAFSLNTGFGVLEVVPGSVAAKAGLQVDDEILSVGRFSVEDAGAQHRAKSYQRMERYHAIVQAALASGSTELVLRRRGNVVRVPLRGQPGCGGRLALTNSPTLNAWSDGRHVVITTGMSALARSNDEIAFVIAHEMAHNILGHSRRGEGNRGIFGSVSSVKRGETEADSYAVHLMARAGYQPAGALTFLSNASRRLWWNVSLSHPGFGSRARIVAAAMRQEQAAALVRQTAQSAAHPVDAPALGTSSKSTAASANLKLASAAYDTPRFVRATAPGGGAMLRPESCGR